MDEKQQNHKNSKIEHVFRDEESIRLLSQAFRGSFLERLILAILAALTIFGGFAVVAWAWHGDVSDKRLESELTQRNTIIQHAEEEIQQLSDVQIAYDIEGNHLRNMIDKKLIICKKLRNLNSNQILSILSEQYEARERYLSSFYKVLFAFPDLSKEALHSARDLAVIYNENINLPCAESKSSDEVGMQQRQMRTSNAMLVEIEKKREKLNALIEEKSNVLSDKLFSN